MERAGFTRDYISLSDGLYRVAFYILESEPEAEDAVQDVLMKLWTMRERLDVIDNPKAFALKMMRNLCLDKVRSRKAHPKVCVSEDTALVQEPDIDSRERLRQVRKAIENLPDKQRRVLVERTIMEKEYDEIASDTGLSEGNLRVILTMARKKLKERIGR